MRLFVLPLLTLALAFPVFAGEGRIELNQAVVDAAGGFPYTISTPGSYVLTSDLVVPADTDAFVLNTSEVVIDLNGFSIRGSYSCSGGCPLGTGLEISPGLSIAFGRDTTVRNGRVSGFGSNCVALNSFAFVSELMVSDCGGIGIGVSSGSIVTSNRVTRTGEQGIRMSGTVHPPTFERNAVSSAGLGGGGFTAVSGGRASAGNSCDDGSCTPHGERRYYLTPVTFDGDEADNPGSCATGYHFASLWEIFDTSSLRYDTLLGLTTDDSGQGPPTNRSSLFGIPTVSGWIRTGGPSSVLGVPGSGNCSGWDLSGEIPSGTTASPGPTLFPEGWEAPGTSTSPWDVSSRSCSSTLSIWCIED